MFTMVAHTEEFEAAVKATLANAFATMAADVAAQAQEIVRRGADYSPVASGQMQSNFKVFESTQRRSDARVRFGIAGGLRNHEVRFERGNVKNVHTDIGEHFYEDGRHCSMDLVGEEGLQENPNAVKRPLTHAMVDVWGIGAVPENAQTFAEGMTNVVRFGLVEPAGLFRKLEDVVGRSI